MPISDLGLTQQEVDAIMADVQGTPGASTGAAAQGSSATNTVTGPEVLQTRTGQSSVQSTSLHVRVQPPQLAQQPVKFNESTPLIPRPLTAAESAAVAKKAASSTAPVLVGITTGMVFGGPVGAAVGGLAMWGLSKLVMKLPQA